ncbi:MAG TPA: hypothetical protein VKM54_16310 [Myxococcota bacterium]|nr:hypothetical protein [Myxococcota bacterium]
MFFPRSLPLTLDESGLHGLRVALNTPVLSIQELPPGPATAAIAIHTEKAGERALTIAVRALRGGEVVFFTLDEDLSEDGAVLGAIDGALSFAEAMGFLFDDEIETATLAQRKGALARWRELVGESRRDSVAAVAPAEELVLEETVELEEAAPSEDPPPRRVEGPRTGSGSPESNAPAAAAGKATSRGVSLTKFRKRSAASTAPRPEGGGRSDASQAAQAARKAVLMTPHGPALGRLQLIKRRRSSDPAAPASWLARLLGSF